MVSSLGAGQFHPTARVSIDNLSQLDSSPTWVSKLSKLRSTCLPLERFSEIASASVQEKHGLFKFAAAELGAGAARQALSRAGLSVADLGVVLADSSTPGETLPTEAQRVAKILEAKLPAFNVDVGSGAVLVQLFRALNLKEESFLKPILFVSTNSPTQLINYTTGDARYLFGDGAAAMVVAPNNEGLLKVLNVKIGSVDTELFGSPKFPAFDFCQIDGGAYLSSVEQRATKLLKEAIETERLESEDFTIIGPQVSPSVASAMQQASGISANRFWSRVDEVGDTLGASAPSVLAERWDEIKPKQKILLVVSGVGVVDGYALLEARE